jgi:catechol 2,3-dioxygenase-like lactoylglutathione lyase family enzyme
LGLTTIVVREYDEAIRFYVDAVGFELISRRRRRAAIKRWVVVAPPPGRSSRPAARQGVEARAQLAAVGNQTGGRVGFFLYSSPTSTASSPADAVGAGVEFLEAPRDPSTYGMVCVWCDLYGNKWDLLEDRA